MQRMPGELAVDDVKSIQENQSSTFFDSPELFTPSNL